MRIILSNDFHNTEAEVCPVAITSGRFAGCHRVSKRQARRAWKQLCGIRECVCGGTFGERGGNHLAVVNEDNNNNFIVEENKWTP